MPSSCEPTACNLMWNMTRKCNFRCSYCYFPHDASAVKENLPVERILALFKKAGGVWTVGLTGGEPLLYPGFVDICLALTKEHFIGLDSNLSIPSRVREFAEAVDPARVKYVYASLHIEERERLKGVDSFIESVILLKERGFNVIVNSVLHPALVERFPADRDYFAERGVDIIPRPFKGEYEEKRYPESYSPLAREILSAYPEAGKKMVFNFKGVPCFGGARFTRLEPDGTFFRCSGDRSVIGRLSGKVRLNSGPEPCQVEKCRCRGLDWVRLSPEQEAFVEGLRLSVVGELDKAREFWDRALALNPDMSNAENNLGVLSWRAGRASEALGRFGRALDIHPGHTLYTANLARGQYLSGSEGKALEILDSLPGKDANESIGKLRAEMAAGEGVGEPRMSNEVAPEGAGVSRDLPRNAR